MATGESAGRGGPASPGWPPVVPPGWPGVGTLLVPVWDGNGGGGVPNGFVPPVVAGCVPCVPALLLTGSSVMELSNRGTLVPDVLSAGTPKAPPPGVVSLIGTRWKRYPPNALVSCHRSRWFWGSPRYSCSSMVAGPASITGNVGNKWPRPS